MTNKNTWILVADGVCASLYSKERLENGQLQLIEHRTFSGINRPTRELRTDRPGSYSGYSAGVARHSLDPRSDRHDYEEFAFVKELAESLNESVLRNEFDSLIIFAAPKALGHLRGALSKNVTSKITAEFNKELTKSHTQDVVKHLEEHRL